MDEMKDRLNITFNEAKGEIDIGREFYALYNFISVEDAMARFKEERWFSLAYECPWLTNTLGFFSWFPVLSGDYAQEDFHSTIAYLNWGWIARTDMGKVKQSVALMDYRVGDVFNVRNGFRGGQYLLSLEGDYSRYAVDAIERSIRIAGFSAAVAPLSEDELLACREAPFRADVESVFTLDGRLVKDPSWELRDCKARIWSLDWTILEDRDFWEL